MDLKRVGAIGYKAEPRTKALLVLAHGAGAGQQHPFMVSMAGLLSAKGIAVVTFDFPYMRERRKVPDRAPVLEAAFREVIDVARGWASGAPLVIGGKSMGGRMATHLGAQGVDGLEGIVVFGYPLHPPGKPDQPRTAHLPSITVPLLIVQGERDTFGTPDELRPVIKTMTTQVTLHVVAKGDHSLTVRGQKRDDTLAQVVDVVVGWANNVRT
jgi:predicted alpha/beta-hydrolase family hydrolase